MKRLLTIALAAVLAVSLCSCCCLTPFASKKEEIPVEQSDASTTTTTTAPETTTTTQQNRLEFDRYTVTLEQGDNLLLTVTASADTSALRWRSSNESVALVNSEGLITALGEGVANVSCTDGYGAEATCTVTVIAASVVPETNENGDVFPRSSSAYLTEEEIAVRLDSFSGETPTGNYAQDAINEIYARHGYVFQNNTIRAFYEAKDWYVADSDFSFGNLSTIEKTNIELLKKFK